MNEITPDALAAERRAARQLSGHRLGCKEPGVGDPDRQWYLGVMGRKDWLAAAFSLRRFWQTRQRLYGCSACSIITENEVRNFRLELSKGDQNDLAAGFEL